MTTSTVTLTGPEDNNEVLSDLDMASSPSRQASLNQRLLKKITRAIKTDPEVDILSLVPTSYSSDIARGSNEPSEVARLNLSAVDRLQSLVNEAPEIDLSLNFPSSYYRSEYERRMKGLSFSEVRTQKRAAAAPEHPKDTLTCLTSISTATVKFPLSDTVCNLISQHCNGIFQSSNSDLLAASLKKLFQKSPKLWEYPRRGAVFKCGTDIVAKVVSGNNDTTEYTSLLYLHQNAPDIPAPRPCGLISLGYFSAIFMSYVPAMTLGKAWPTLQQDQKLNVQHQLNDIFLRLRQLKPKHGSPLGGLHGEGVKDHYREDYQNTDPVETTADFENWKFSIAPHASQPYVTFLKRLLPYRTLQPVFTHGDLRPANIMVEMDTSGTCNVTGIIDWEDSGFYPDYHESTKCTKLLDMGEDSDWYDYLPACIQPTNFAQWWLVDRLWGRNVACGK